MDSFYPTFRALPQYGSAATQPWITSGGSFGDQEYLNAQRNLLNVPIADVPPPQLTSPWLFHNHNRLHPHDAFTTVHRGAPTGVANVSFPQTQHVPGNISLSPSDVTRYQPSNTSNITMSPANSSPANTTQSYPVVFPERPPGESLPFNPAPSTPNVNASQLGTINPFATPNANNATNTLPPSRDAVQQRLEDYYAQNTPSAAPSSFTPPTVSDPLAAYRGLPDAELANRLARLGVDPQTVGLFPSPQPMSPHQAPQTQLPIDPLAQYRGLPDTEVARRLESLGLDPAAYGLSPQQRMEAPQMSAPNDPLAQYRGLPDTEVARRLESLGLDPAAYGLSPQQRMQTSQMSAPNDPLAQYRGLPDTEVARRLESLGLDPAAYGLPRTQAEPLPNAAYGLNGVPNPNGNNTPNPFQVQNPTPQPPPLPPGTVIGPDGKPIFPGMPGNPVPPNAALNTNPAAPGQVPPAPTPAVKPEPPEADTPEPPVKPKSAQNILTDAMVLSFNTQLNEGDAFARGNTAMDIYNLIEKHPQLLAADSPYQDTMQAFLLKILRDPDPLVRQGGLLVFETNLFDAPNAAIRAQLEKLASSHSFHHIEGSVAQTVLGKLQPETGGHGKTPKKHGKASAHSELPAVPGTHQHRHGIWPFRKKSEPEIPISSLANMNDATLEKALKTIPKPPAGLEEGSISGVL